MNPDSFKSPIHQVHEFKKFYERKLNLNINVNLFEKDRERE